MYSGFKERRKHEIRYDCTVVVIFLIDILYILSCILFCTISLLRGLWFMFAGLFCNLKWCFEIRITCYIIWLMCRFFLECIHVKHIEQVSTGTHRSFVSVRLSDHCLWSLNVPKLHLCKSKKRYNSDSAYKSFFKRCVCDIICTSDNSN